jgi:hypothetical protein
LGWNQAGDFWGVYTLHFLSICSITVIITKSTCNY